MAQSLLSRPMLSRGVNRDQLAGFSRELSMLLDAGVPLMRALAILHKRSQQPKLKRTLSDVIERIERGGDLATSLAVHADVFDDLFVNVIKTGEVGGALDRALRRLADHLERESSLRRRTRNALLYPALVVGTAVVVLWAIMVFVVPEFTRFYQETGVALPWPTQVVQFGGLVLVRGWWLLLLAAGGALAGVYRYIQTPRGRARWDGFKLHFYPTRQLYRKLLATRFATTLSTLIENGIGLVPALRLTGDTVENVVYGDVCREAARRVEAGESLVDVLQESSYFPVLFLDMVGVGEEAGSLDSALEHVTRTYQEETELTLDAVVKLTQPVLVLVVGGVVLLLAAAVLLPYFGMHNIVVAY